jgi:hypothetical protein
MNKSFRSLKQLKYQLNNQNKKPDQVIQKIRFVLPDRALASFLALKTPD